MTDYGLDKWATGLSKYIKPQHRLIVKDGVTLFAQGSSAGIQFCVGATEMTVKKCDAAFTCDWVFNCSRSPIYTVTVGDFMACVVLPELVDAIAAAANNVFIYTGGSTWIYLEKRDVYMVEIDGSKQKCWIGSGLSFDDVLGATCLEECVTDDGLAFFRSAGSCGTVVPIMLARCEKSMWLLDSVHRDYIQERSWSGGEIVAVKSVAGSGKTTTLLSLAKTHKGKKMLYLAFNKSLITEIGAKLKKQGITNLEPKTFDSLLYGLYQHHKKTDPAPINLLPQNVGDYCSWLQDKPFGLRKGIVGNFSKWCNDYKYSDIKVFCKEVLGKESQIIESLWTAALAGKLTTFETIRKMALTGHWCAGYVDKHYDMILVDETQDFDMQMLRMLLDDTTLPKLFVGDTKQAIYQWRGCINAFDYLPERTLHVEFYSTFRVGEPACSTIRNQFEDCWMISKSKRPTTIGVGALDNGANYVYLFRTWRVLLQTAQTMSGIWIYGFEKKMEQVRKLHKTLLGGGRFDEDDFEDDLPKFLKSITAEDLDALIAGIEAGLVDKRVATCKMYTVHSYKGLENDLVRLAYDIDKKKDENIYYVACTRGMENIVFDAVPESELNKDKSLAAALLRPNAGKKKPAVAATKGGVVTKPAFVPPVCDLLDSSDCQGNGDCLEQCGHPGHNGYCSMGSTCDHKCAPIACKNVGVYKCKTMYPKWILETHSGLCFECRQRKR